MKKTLIALAALGSAAGAAQAQSSVTLYGLVDVGLNYTSNVGGKRLYNTTSGVEQANRWGLRGMEDLGGGLSAIFVLENGFNLNTGALGQNNPGSSQGLEFGRQAYVGLSNAYGTVTMGRQYDSVVDFVGPLATGNQWLGNNASHPGDLDNFSNLYRVNNAIKYASPSIHGFKFGGLYSLGGVAGDVTRNQLFSLGASYVSGPLSVAAAYLNSRNPNLGFFGNNGASTAATATSSFIPSPVYSGFASAHTYQVIGVGGAYAIGATTIGATYSNVQFMGLGDTTSGPNVSGFTGKAIFNNAEVSFKYQATPALVAGVSYDYTNGSSVSSSTGPTGGSKYNQFAAGADYSLSKRTDVYIVGVYQKASGTDSRNMSAVAVINNVSPSNSDTQAVVRVGLRHRF
jgi:predicted porin